MPPPRDIAAETQRGELVITWGDGQVQRLSFVFVRSRCGCAKCEDEMTGARRLDPATIPKDIRVRNMELVGNYAVRITWSDGHKTGMYTWEGLREMGRENQQTGSGDGISTSD